MFPSSPVADSIRNRKQNISTGALNRCLQIINTYTIASGVNVRNNHSYLVFDQAELKYYLRLSSKHFEF